MAKTHAIGIDLGTTYSAIAHLNEAGRPEILPNALGERTTPSAVLFEPNGSTVVGSDAINSLGIAPPDRFARWVKRRMGDASWRMTVDGRTYGAVDISARILRSLKEDAERLLNAPVGRAVITVPAYFDEARRHATVEAARMAGLEPLRIINEPTAAALAYAQSGHVSGRLLVYDFGGGTFDVSVVEVRSPSEITVLSTAGDPYLGGHDVDVLFAEHVLGRNGDPIPTDRDGDEDWLELLAEVETAKRRLSSRDEVAVARRGSLSSMVKVARSEFDASIATLIKKTQLLIEDALEASSLAPRDIDAVLLVGGSSRIAAVTDLIRDMFGRDPLRQISPDEVVALGASIQAGIVLAAAGEIDLPEGPLAAIRDVRLQDVAPHSFGTIVLHDSTEGQLRNDIIIPKNTPIPHSVTKSYRTPRDGQTAIDCRVTQGEHTDPSFVTTVASEQLALPPDRPKGCEIQVTYTYDVNGQMRCEFLDVESGRRSVLAIHPERRK
jgi:molecular chaperone DnaK